MISTIAGELSFCGWGHESFFAKIAKGARIIASKIKRWISLEPLAPVRKSEGQFPLHCLI